jgi:plasmid stabilization system protein ParE
MRRTYSLVPSAVKDFRQIVLYYAERSIVGVRTISEALDKTMTLLASQPQMGRVYDEKHRAFPVRQFLIVYRPDTRPLQIIRIWDERQKGRPKL